MSNFYPIWFKLGLEMISFTNKTDKYKCVSVRLSVSLSFCQFVSLSVCLPVRLTVSVLPVRHSSRSSLSVCHYQFVTLSVRHSFNAFYYCTRLWSIDLVCTCTKKFQKKHQINFWGGFHVERDQLRGESKFELNKLAKDVKDATLSMYDHYLRCIFSIACLVNH